MQIHLGKRVCDSNFLPDFVFNISIFASNLNSNVSLHGSRCSFCTKHVYTFVSGDAYLYLLLSKTMKCSHVCSQQTTFLLLPTTCSPMRNGSYLTRSSWYSITSLTTQSQRAVASKWLEKLRPIADQERRKSNSEGAQRAERRAKVQRVRRIADLPVLQPYISFLLICELNILNGPL